MANSLGSMMQDVRYGLRNLIRNPGFALVAMLYNLVYWFSPYGKSMDYSNVADLVAERAAPGDCLIIDDTMTWSHEYVRAMTAARPAA